MSNRTALFMIDIQNDLATDPKTRIPHAKRVIDAGTAILAAARGVIDAQRNAARTPSGLIVVVQHEEAPEEGTLVRGSEPWKVVFSPREGNEDEILVAKTTREILGSRLCFSAFRSSAKATNLRGYLRFEPRSR
jgi:nicotinamidase-related amidase